MWIYTRSTAGIIINRLSEVAKRKELPDVQVALAWLMSKPYITAPIIGASKPGHLEDAVGALSVKLTSDEIHQLEELYSPHQVSGHS